MVRIYIKPSVIEDSSNLLNLKRDFVLANHRHGRDDLLSLEVVHEPESLPKAEPESCPENVHCQPAELEPPKPNRSRYDRRGRQCNPRLENAIAGRFRPCLEKLEEFLAEPGLDKRQRQLLQVLLSEAKSKAINRRVML